MLPVHHLWLGYMAEIANLPILIPTLLRPPVDTATPVLTQTTTALLPMFPPRNPPPGTSIAADLKINVVSLHAKLVKAEFIGCILSGTLFIGLTMNCVAHICDATVKRAKNPSLAQLTGIVLQETQSTFKIVTTSNAIKSQSIPPYFHSPNSRTTIDELLFRQYCRRKTRFSPSLSPLSFLARQSLRPPNESSASIFMATRSYFVQPTGSTRSGR